MYRITVSVMLVLAGALVGAGVMWATGRNQAVARPEDAGAAPGKLWTCSMHPQIRLDHPGICPLCGMDLTPLDARQDPWEAEDPSVRLVLGEHARRMASVDTRLIEARELFKEIRTVGRIELDETRVAQIASRVNGRVEQVFADFPGTPVRRGEHLVSIYSPELLSTQEEYLTALRREQAQKAAGVDLALNLSAASRRRLQLWGITDSQLDELAQTGKSQDRLVVYAPIGGTVIEKKVRPGQYVKEGDVLYTIADLGQVWLILEVYESELSWVQIGQPVEVTLESEPQRPVRGTVAFIEPLLTKETRTVQVRVILENTAGRFKPGMYAQATLR
ncbi:MAG: efflux RND transporter periplasmic adaptor subunit, partial [Thermoguttaceae bacterium]|nr:efflux RND transporter periplasmic adaptor subunit [Thermoguttaceae bacterium]